MHKRHVLVSRIRHSRCAGYYEEHDRERDERRVGQEGHKPAQAEDGQADLGSGTYNDEGQSDGWHHQPCS